MNNEGHFNCKRYNDRGISILIIAVSMIFILGIAGLGIDLASLYVARSQAQRAADAGALAAAQYLANGSCTGASGAVSANCQATAEQRAAAVTNANLIAGVSPNIDWSNTNDVKFLQTDASDPQIQVTAGRNTAHGNPMPTFFVKIFGINSANISAQAVAEAYNPSGGDSPSVTQCLKPWLMPNCNQNVPYTSSSPGYDDPNCNGTVQFVSVPYPTPTSLSPSDAQPTLPADQTLGETITVKSSLPTNASGPSKFYPVYLPTGSVASACPSCANNGGGSPNSSQPYENNIECCNTSAITCGPQQVQPITGDMVGPTGIGVDCLIHESKSGSGQDTIQFPGQNNEPYTMFAGLANPYGASNGSAIGSSDSMVTIPLYDGATLCPGNNSCPAQVTVTVVGFLQMFIVGETNGNVSAQILNVVGCPGTTSNSNGSGSVSGGGSSPIPVRLIHE